MEKKLEYRKLDLNALDQVAGGDSSEPETCKCPNCLHEMVKVNQTTYYCMFCKALRDMVHLMNGYDKPFAPDAHPYKPHGPEIGDGISPDFAPDDHWA